MAKQKSAKKLIVYVTPPRTEIDRYARTVCQELSKELGQEFNAPSVWIDLASFLEIVASICAKEKNHESSET